METADDLRDPVLDPPPGWADREPYWRRELGRLKLGVEPIADQLARYRAATTTLMAVAGGVALMFVALFSAFGAPAIGLAVAGVLVGPVAALAWLDYRGLARRAARYEAERRAYEAKAARG